MNCAGFPDREGLVQAPHTILAELLHLDTLYWPIEQIEQLVQVKLSVMPNPVEYVPDWQVVHAAWELTAALDEYVPA